MTRRTARRFGAAVLSLLVVASVPTVAAAAPTRAAQAAPAKVGPLSPRLAVLAGGADAPTQRPAPSSEQIDGLNTAADGRIYVDVRVADAAALATADAVAGIEVEATTPDGGAATLAVPAGQLGALADIRGLLAADEVPAPQVHRTDRAIEAAPSITAASTCPSGTTVSAGSAQLKVPAARSAFGVDGTGVAIGIISDSYGVNSREASNNVKSGDLPGTGNPCGHTTPVQIVADAGDGTDEGRAMAQIVHDLAPGAKLLFADAGASQIEMASHVRALRDAGAQVIVDDIGYLDNTLYQDGYLAAAVDEVVADGVTYLSSAGNQNLTVGGKSVGSYETQAFRPTACPSVVGPESTCHDFDPGPGVSAKDVVTVPAGGTLLLNLGWNEAIYDVSTDLDLFLLDDATGELIDLGGAANPRSGRPTEWAYYANTDRTAKKVQIVVANYGNLGTPRFKSIFYAPSLASVQWNTASGGDVFGPTLYGHAGSPSAIAVGAMTPAASPAIESFSSRGPATQCWEPAHARTPAAAIPDCTTKTVDILGTDGIATTVSGFDPFYGTSAAAPHVAAVAALLKQDAPCATPADIRAALRGGAIALGAVDAGGSGRTDALAALDDLTTCSPRIGAPVAPAVTTVSATSVQVTISAPAVSEWPAVGYELDLIRPGGEVVTTKAASGAGGMASFTVDLPVEVGRAYRVRGRTDHVIAKSPWSASSVLIVPPFSSAAAYMDQLGSDFSGRALTDDERQVLTFLLDDDYGPAEAAYEAAHFDPWSSKIDPVIRLFLAYFNRKPDAGGLTYWLGKRRSGTTLDKISSTFAGSSEFTTRYGALTNKQFVNLVYQNVLGRSGDIGGVKYWTAQLDTRRRSRGQVMTGFSESSEHLRRRYGTSTTIDLYFGMLRRIPTTAELAEWSPLVAADLESSRPDGAKALLQQIFTSTEYLDRFS
jgi:hypothetical protein